MIRVVGSLLLLYSWIVAAILIFSLFLIGRFYELKIRQKSNYQLLLIPLILFLIAAGWTAIFAFTASKGPASDFVGMGADVLFLIGGLGLIALCYSLYRIMIARKG